MNTSTARQTSERTALREMLRTMSKLFKFRVVLLLVWAAMGGAFLGAHGRPTLKDLALLVITGTLAAAGSSAINQYLEQDVDARMRRTQRRPLPAGLIEHPHVILGIALAMILIAVFMVLPSNPTMSLYLALGALIYVGVYTIWLKPRSVLNIVIGGAAGSCAVMTGGAAVGAASDPGVIALALLLFTWSPTHFWALALYYKEDYARGNFPMLPVHASPSKSAWWIFVHAMGTGTAAILLALHPSLGWIYLIPAGAATGLLIYHSAALITNPTSKRAIRLFITSNFFLLLILLAIMLVSTGRQFFAS